MSTPTLDDEQIVAGIVEWADRSGMPGRNRVVAQFGIGASRAARLLAAADQVLAARSGPVRNLDANLPQDPDADRSGPQETGPADRSGQVRKKPVRRSDPTSPVRTDDAVRSADRPEVRTGPAADGGPVREADRPDRTDGIGGEPGPDQAIEPVRSAGPDRKPEEVGPVTEQVSSPDRTGPGEVDRQEVDILDRSVAGPVRTVGPGPRVTGPDRSDVERSGAPVRVKPGPVRRPQSGPDRWWAGPVRLWSGLVGPVRGLVRSDRSARSGPADRGVVAVRTARPVRRTEAAPVRSDEVGRSGPAVVRTETVQPDADRTGPGAQPSDTQRPKWVSVVDTMVTAVPLLGLNAAAVFGQYSALSVMPGISHEGALGIAAVLESLALFLSHHAHRALMEGDSAARLRIASYLLGLGIGVLNYHDQAGPHWKATPLAVVYGLASALSPWLWAIHSRFASRAKLRAKNLLDPRAAKFSGARWSMYPIRTFQMLRKSIWSGEQDPAVVVDQWNQEEGHVSRRSAGE